MKILLLGIFLLLVGCGHTPDEILVPVPVFVPVICGDFGRIEPVKALPVRFVQAIDTDGNKVLGLRGDQYSNLSIVMADALRFIKEQKKAIEYYKFCIELHNSEQLNEEGEP